MFEVMIFAVVVVAVVSNVTIGAVVLRGWMRKTTREERCRGW